MARTREGRHRSRVVGVRTHRSAAAGIGRRSLDIGRTALAVVGILVDIAPVLLTVDRHLFALAEVLVEERIHVGTGSRFGIDTAVRQIDLLTAVARHEHDVVETIGRSLLGREADVEEFRSLLEREVRRSVHPVGVFGVAGIGRVVDLGPLLTVAAQGHLEGRLVERVVELAASFGLEGGLCEECQFEVGLLGRQLDLVDREPSGQLTEEEHVGTRAVVGDTRLADRNGLAAVGHLAGTRTRRIPRRILVDEGVGRNVARTHRLLEDHLLGLHLADVHHDGLALERAHRIGDREGHLARTVACRNAHGHLRRAVARLGSQRQPRTRLGIHRSGPRTIGPHLEPVAAVHGHAIGVEVQDRRSNFQIGSLRVFVIVDARGERRSGHRDECAERQL